MILLRSLVELNLGVQENAGWCLSMARLVFRAPAGYAHATASWNAARFKNTSREMPNVAVPVYFKWVNPIKSDPNYGVDQGHVVAWVPGRGFLSSPGSGFGQKWFGSIVEIEKFFGCTYRGWTQDINGKRVAEPAPVQPPVVVTPPVTTGNGGDYRLVVEVSGYTTASNAANREASNSRVPAGDYKIFNESHGMVNVTPDASKPGWWINPSENVAPAPQPVAPAFSVGDRVAPNSKQTNDYNGAPVYAWHEAYTITELIDNRAVLSVDGTIWAAMNTANIHKV